MTIATGSIDKDATLTPSGGTAQAFNSLGPRDGKHVVHFDGNSIFDRTSVEFSIREPKAKPDAPNGYTQARNSALLKMPLALDNGGKTVNTLGLNLSVDPETTAAEITTMLVYAAQLLVDSDLSAFWTNQSME